jgi:nitrite reductase/ring-hydroxylating ferredoxin subunit
VSTPDILRATLRRVEEAKALDTPGKVLRAIAQPLTRSNEMKNALSGTWLGHRLHPVLTDAPIGAWVSASVLDVVGGRHAGKAARRLVGVGVLSAVPTAMAGLSDWNDTYGGEQRSATVHAAANGVALVLQLASWRARGRGHGLRGRVFSLVALGAVVTGGYIGGHLVYNLQTGVDDPPAELPPGTWYDTVALDEMVDDRPHGITIEGVPVVLVRSGMTVFALGGTCSHRGGPLADGTVDVQIIRCPWHGSEFRLDNGAVVRAPATTPQPTFEARVRDGLVQLRARDVEAPAPGLATV